LGFAIRLSALPSTGYGASLGNSGGSQVTVRCNSDGSISVIRGDYTGTLLGSSAAGIITSSEWNYVEIKIVIDDSTGSYEVRVNGSNILSDTGVDTAALGDSDATWLRLRSGNVVWTYYTDIYFGTDFLGDCRYDILSPDGAGDNTDWTPSAGANYECVDEIPPDDDTTTVTSDTVTDRDDYAFDDLAALTGSTIHAVTLNVVGKKTDAGARGIDPYTRISASNYNGSEVSLTESYKNHQQIWETNPDDSQAWEEADVNGAKFGAELVT
jgi:hypothetical protein